MYKFSSNKDTRTNIQNIIASGVTSINWKIDINTWVVISNTQLLEISNLINTLIQDSFTWEMTKILEIDTVTVLENLLNVELPVDPSVRTRLI